MNLVHVLPYSLQTWVSAKAKPINTAPDFLLTTFSVLLGNTKLIRERDGYFVYPNIYIINVSNKGTGKN
jgi:hypothetical protein